MFGYYSKIPQTSLTICYLPFNLLTLAIVSKIVTEWEMDVLLTGGCDYEIPTPETPHNKQSNELKSHKTNIPNELHVTKSNFLKKV